jgi:radical SAM superfamily enzyme YgiQ (UPF0313 family)
MMKPGMGTYDRFKQMFEKASKEAGKEQYLIPYFIAAHPGTTDEDMLELASGSSATASAPTRCRPSCPRRWPLATAMWHTGKNPLRKSRARSEGVPSRGGSQRKLHKAFLRYHDPKTGPCCARP